MLFREGPGPVLVVPGHAATRPALDSTMARAWKSAIMPVPTMPNQGELQPCGVTG